MDRMNSADEKVFEEALSGALADIQSDWENPDALLLACKDALPPDYVPSRRFSRKMQLSLIHISFADKNVLSYPRFGRAAGSLSLIHIYHSLFLVLDG